METPVTGQCSLAGLQPALVQNRHPSGDIVLPVAFALSRRPYFSVPWVGGAPLPRTWLQMTPCSDLISPLGTHHCRHLPRGTAPAPAPLQMYFLLKVSKWILSSKICTLRLGVQVKPFAKVLLCVEKSREIKTRPKDTGAHL